VSHLVVCPGCYHRAYRKLANKKTSKRITLPY
jgi:hypothetical protein